MICALLHRLRHRLHLQRGFIVSEWFEGRLWIGFRCETCGEVTGAHDVSDEIAGWHKRRTAGKLD